MNCWVEIFSPRMDSFALVKQIFKGYWIVCAVRCTWSLSCIWLFVTPRTVVCQAPLSTVILLARILEWVVMPSSRGFSQPKIEPRSPALQADSLPAEPPGKPKNAGVGSLSLLQQMYSTQESNWGLLHYRRILYQLNYQGSPLRFSTSTAI